MEYLKEQIEEAAELHSNYIGNEKSPIMLSSFIIGAKSDAARAYWQHGMFTRQQLDEAIEVGINEELRKQNNK